MQSYTTARRRQVMGERERHRCVVPEDVSGDALTSAISASTSCTQVAHDRVCGQPGGRCGTTTITPDCGSADCLQARGVGVEHRLFKEKHAALASAACQQVLRALKDEVPAEV